MIKIFTLAGNEVRENFICLLITVIASTPELQAYTVNKAYFAMKENLNQTGMVQLGIWLIGEFGEHLLYGTTLAADDTPIQVDEIEVIELFEKVMQEHKQKTGERSEIIVEYALTALSKLTVRFTKSKNRIVELVEGCTESSKIEI